MTNADILDIALAQSAINCCGTPEDFFAAEHIVHIGRPRTGLPAYFESPQICDLVSYGSNVVACCTAELSDPVATWLGSLDTAHDAFETPEIYRLNELLAPVGARVQYQAEYFLPDADAVFAVTPTCPYELRILDQDDFHDLYLPAWSNALCDKRPQLDVLGVGAYDGDTLVGLAGCSTDCEHMWQIGIDVLPSHRRQGIAATLTNRLAREVFARDEVPFYCAAWSNVRSVRNALASGFKPAWVEATARYWPARTSTSSADVAS